MYALKQYNIQTIKDKIESYLTYSISYFLVKNKANSSPQHQGSFSKFLPW